MTIPSTADQGRKADASDKASSKKKRHSKTKANPKPSDHRLAAREREHLVKKAVLTSSTASRKPSKQGAKKNSGEKKRNPSNSTPMKLCPTDTQALLSTCEGTRTVVNESGQGDSISIHAPIDLRKLFVPKAYKYAVSKEELKVIHDIDTDMSSGYDGPEFLVDVYACSSLMEHGACWKRVSLMLSASAQSALCKLFYRLDQFDFEQRVIIAIAAPPITFEAVDGDGNIEYTHMVDEFRWIVSYNDLNCDDIQVA